MNKLRDQELALKIAEGAIEAFDELYARYKSKLYGYLAAMTCNPALTDDLLQELFLQIYKNPTPFSKADDFQNYLFRAARNLAVKALGNAGKKTETLKNVMNSLLLPSPSKDGEVCFAEPGQLASLTSALTTLADDEREIVLLHAFEGLSFGEIENIMEMPKPTIYKKYRKALETLCRELKRLDIDGEFET